MPTGWGRRAGTTEKAEGDELAPTFINGVKNGLTPSHCTFAGENGQVETEKK
jgi:hypothetical protein